MISKMSTGLGRWPLLAVYSNQRGNSHPRQDRTKIPSCHHGVSYRSSELFIFWNFLFNEHMQSKTADKRNTWGSQALSLGLRGVGWQGMQLNIKTLESLRSQNADVLGNSSVGEMKGPIQEQEGEASAETVEAVLQSSDSERGAVTQRVVGT